MANLIDKSFFVGELNIPNTGDTKISERLEWFIAKYEPLCLTEILGYPLYAYLLANKTATPIVDLLNGKVYVNNYGKQTKWIGLVNPDQKLSLIANFVYFWYMRDAATQTTGQSVIIKKGEMAINTSPATKMVSAWNEFSRQSQQMVDFLLSDSTKASYPLYTRRNGLHCYNYSASINEFDI